jgi:hypothetical protein
MSGGHFGYGCFKISQFADDLQHEIDQNDDTSVDQWGSQRGRGFDKTTIDKIQQAQRVIAYAAALAKELEWLYSDDTGPESFVAAVNDITDKHNIGE